MDAANDDAANSFRVEDSDLQAYVEDRLGAERRREVEGLLACNPDLAARVMTRLHMQAPRTRRRSSRRGFAIMLAMALMSSLAAGMIGWTAAAQRSLGGWREADGDSPPQYVQEAAEARVALHARELMASQLETPTMDGAEIHRLLKIQAPKLPQDWRVLDAQVFPTDDGPGLNLVIETPGAKRLVLFAVRAATYAGDRPEVALHGADEAVFWEAGNSAYVLSGNIDRHNLLKQAWRLSRG